MASPPDKYFVYIDEANRTATTWMGEKLGDVTFGHAYRAVFGDVRVPVWVTGINGVKYYGTYYKSAGNYARIQRAKGSRMLANPKSSSAQPKVKFNLERVRLDQGGYDRFGMYFGRGAPLYHYMAEVPTDRYFYVGPGPYDYGTEPGGDVKDVDDYLRAYSRDDAKDRIREQYPFATFYR